MIDFTAIASGSNGNCYYVGNGNEAVLVDAGISAKQIVQRMTNVNLDIGKIKGIFVTHEHTDHVRGISVLARKNSIPVYITEKTLESVDFDVSPSLIRIIEQSSKISVGDLTVDVFSKHHDAMEPISITVSYNGKSVSVLTDIGFPCENVIRNVSRSDVIFLEANYDEKLLEDGDYPVFLKRRITGKLGHLSNLDSARLIYKYASPRLKYLFLSHLSENNNTAGEALAIMEKALAERSDLDVKLLITDRYGEMPVSSL